ncbi:unnamed protein product [Adineta steineri]|uniref:Uncharacterized protein n=1 Tax=Adineta steineri TaxID=433720 RepID=A0A818VM28_9BILA|nr:unnamed protein product [Adineta steineri]CAF3710203.1 unnamed protein product [Adineta steineri]
MTTTIIVHSPPDDDDEIQSQTEQRQFLSLPTSDLPTQTTIFKPFPQSILKTIENDRKHRLSHSRSAADFLHLNQSSIDTVDDDLYDNYDTITAIDSKRKHSLLINSTRPRSPSDIRINIDPDISSHQHSINLQNKILSSTYENETHHSDPSLLSIKTSKQKRAEYLRRHVLERRFGHRMHSTFSSSSSTLRSLGRRFPLPTISPRLNHRKRIQYLSKDSKWHLVRNNLTKIAMMSDSYARMKIIQGDLRWKYLRELIDKQILDIREMSLLRQQYDGTLKKSQKSNSELKSIHSNEVVHIEHDGRVFSMNTRDLVLGRVNPDENIQLDTLAQFEARRKFRIKQSLLKQQEGRTRLKKYIAFSFCLCNLSFIAFMFVSMFMFAMKTIIELRTTELF